LRTPISVSGCPVGTYLIGSLVCFGGCSGRFEDVVEVFTALVVEVGWRNESGTFRLFPFREGWLIVVAFAQSLLGESDMSIIVCWGCFSREGAVVCSGDAIFCFGVLVEDTEFLEKHTRVGGSWRRCWSCLVAGNCLGLVGGPWVKGH